MLKRLAILGGMLLALYLVLNVSTLVTGGGNTAKPRPTATRTVPPTPSPTATPTPTTAPTRPPRPTPPPVTVSGVGEMASGVFALEGEYEVSINLGGNCEYFGYLKSTDGFYNNLDLFSDQGPFITRQRLRAVPAGMYYSGVRLGATSVPPCPWTLTFTAR